MTMLRKAPEGTPKTWDEWTDPLGNTYRPGDLVAVAAIDGRSPVLRFGRVQRINRINSKGQLIEDVSWMMVDRNGERARVETREPSCTVTILEEFNGRGFRRWGKAKANTYRHPGNVVKVDAAEFEANETIKKELGLD